jgi:thioredoxin 1
MKGNFNHIVRESKPVIVDFHAEWCGPCKIQTPILKEIATELGDRIKVIKIDVDQNQLLAGKYRIQSVPTLMIFKNGEEKYRQSGVHSKAQIMNVIMQL